MKIETNSREYVDGGVSCYETSNSSHGVCLERDDNAVSQVLLDKLLANADISQPCLAVILTREKSWGRFRNDSICTVAKQTYEKRVKSHSRLEWNKFQSFRYILPSDIIIPYDRASESLSNEIKVKLFFFFLDRLNEISVFHD